MIFKVGDRCSFYRDGERYEGIVETASDNPHSSISVRVTKAPDGNPEATTWGFIVHPKQCRKLKPKPKRKEFWIIRWPVGKTTMHYEYEVQEYTEGSGVSKFGQEDVDFIRVREVLK